MFASRSAVAQCKDCEFQPINILGSHDDGGRGCVGCHIHHVDARTGDGGRAIWGQSVNQSATKSEPVEKPLENGIPGTLSEYGGVLLCISCHDGNIVPENMVANQPHEGSASSGGQVVPTALDDRRGPWVEHPLGPGATIETGNGLQFSNGVFSVSPGSPYAQFVSSYGWPCLAPRHGSNHYGIDKQGRPYIVCMTCHDAHGNNVYVSRPGSPIANESSGQYYPTFFFVNGPYNPHTHSMDNRTSTSNVQFCRQCHFHLSNEANNLGGIPTKF